MIKKTLLFTILLLSGYTLLVTVINPHFECAQQVVQKNVIRAEKFLYDEGDTLQHILTGSSLVGGFVMDSLPSFYNMSFAAKTSLDGLRIIARKENPPKKVYVEINTILQKEDEEFSSAITFPITYYSRKILPSLRENKHPIGILGNGIAGKIPSAPTPEEKPSAPSKTAVSENKNENSVFDMLLNERISDYQNPPSKEEISKRLNHLKLYVSELEKKGTEIVFFEMPVDERLFNLPKAKITREGIYALFPPDKYHYIYSPDCSEYATGDGVHLTEESLLRYTLYFRSHLK